MKPFIKVGDHIFHRDHITHVSMDVDGLILVDTPDTTDGSYSVKRATPEGQRFLIWLAAQWEDVMAEQEEPEALQLLETPSGVRFGVSE